MERLAIVLEGFSARIDKAIHFFDGFGMLLMQLFGMLVIMILFYYLVPQGYRGLLKWATIFGCVSCVAEWLATK